MEFGIFFVNVPSKKLAVCFSFLLSKISTWPWFLEPIAFQLAKFLSALAETSSNFILIFSPPSFFLSANVEVIMALRHMAVNSGTFYGLLSHHYFSSICVISLEFVFETFSTLHLLYIFWQGSLLRCLSLNMVFLALF